MAHCTICGQLVSETSAQAVVGGSDTSSRKSSICTLCIDKLGSGGRTDRTTILRPIATLNVHEDSAENPRQLVLSEGTPQDASGLVIPPSSMEAADAPKVDASGSVEPLLSRTFGSYEILCEISRGSFGVVYKAKQQGLDRITALKVLLAGVHASPEAVARFHREAKAVARLKHPNIVPVYEIGTQDGHHYFAMEFIEGHALSQKITSKTISISDALSIAEALADALESAHQCGVIHRDVKPSNVLIDVRGQPHITDFGLAKQVDLDVKYTMSGTTLGTPAYMPPEQARGEIERIDARSDVYAIGAVLYEMLTGQTPFAGRSVLEVVVAVINEPVRPPRQLNPKIHRDVQTIVLKCLEKDPRLRYASAAELRDDLRRFRSGEAIRARPAGIVRRAVRFLARHYVALIAFAAIAFAVGFALKVKQEQQLAEADNEKLQKQLLAKASVEAVWRPDWWFPPKRPETLVNEEVAKLYKVPEGRDQLFLGLVKGKEGWDLHTKRVKPRETLPEQVIEETGHENGAGMLVSPEELRFYGDVDADVTFKLLDLREAESRHPGQKESFRLRFGLQSVSSAKGFDGIPFIAEFYSGRVRVIGPYDMYAHTSPSEGEHRGQPKLEIKAEKYAPTLIPGEYTLNLHRDGTSLRFRLSGPSEYPGCTIEIKDLNLSNWVFKNTQLVVRDLPPGAELQSAEVRRKYGDDDPDRAFSFFRVGDYNVAEAELKVIASGKDPLKRARARYQLGLIQEICQPTTGAELRFYSDALNDLEQVPASDAAVPERDRLARELHQRKLLRFARIRQWRSVLDELNEGWGGGASIGEPLAWELHLALEMLLKENEPDAAIKIQTALAIFQRLGVEAGSARFGRWADELAALLVAERRFESLVTLHKAFPTATLIDDFFAAAQKPLEKNDFEQSLRMLSYIAPFCRSEKELAQLAEAGSAVLGATLKTRHYEHAARLFTLLPAMPELKVLCAEMIQQSKTLADEAELDAYLTKLLPVVIARLPQDQAASKMLENALEKLCESVIAGVTGENASEEMVNKIIRVHETLCGRTGPSDPRLADAFARALQKLAQIEDPQSDEQAERLLKYCAMRVVREDAEIRRGVFAVARAKTHVESERPCEVLFRLHHAYPTPELLRLVSNVMLELNHPQRMQHAQTVGLFCQARVEFGADAKVLTPLVLSALERIRMVEERLRLTKTLEIVINDGFRQRYRATVEGSAEQAAEAAADRQWRLEYGDIQLVLNQWEPARETYLTLFDAPRGQWALKTVEPELRAKAAIRLAAMALARPGSATAGDYLLPLLNIETLPDEYKLAARLLATPEQVMLTNLDGQIKTLRAPLLLNESEWELLRGLRTLIDGQANAAGGMFRSAETKASAARSWVLAVASALGRPGDESNGRARPSTSLLPGMEFAQPLGPTK